ncbi:serine/threonine-protein kinase [Mycolicibacterium arenosum]|nr:serine/threonine-protein kinase [Mycolicibacterium sp. CAU 1645]
MQGVSFGRYRLEALLGRGGMGEVWRAHDIETDRTVALKLLPANLADDEQFKERFRREARVAASLNDPHVVPIHGFGEIDGRLYVDMRLIEGRDLGAILDDGALPPATAVAIVEQIGAALQAAHTAGLVHRDVKPSNVIVTDAGFAYLIDFGIARAVDDTGLTSTGVAVGTWAYMAPERFASDRYDHRADVYSLACVLHQCLTGQRPFPGQSAERQMAGHLHTPPPRPSAVVRGVPRALDAVIAHGLAKDPAARPSTASGFAAEARAALAEPTVVAPPTRPHEQSFAPGPLPATAPEHGHRRTWILAAAGVAVAVSVAVVLAVGLRGGGSDPAASSNAPVTTGGRTTSKTTTTTSGPSDPNAPWSGQAASIAAKFPGLIPATPGGEGYRGTSMCAFTSGDVEGEINCMANQMMWVTCNTLDRKEGFDTLYPSSSSEVREADWTRASGSGKVRWYRGMVRSFVEVIFDDPDRDTCVVTARGDGTPQELYDQWFLNAPI